MATKMKMITKGGKKVPAFAADGKGKMKMGGAKMKKFEPGGVNDFEERQRRKRARAETRAEIAAIEGEGTVSDKKNNRAARITQIFGTGRAKTPKSISTSTSTSTSNTDNSNSGNTSNITSSGSSSGSSSGASADSGSSSNSNSRSSSTTPINTGSPAPRKVPRPVPAPRTGQTPPKQKIGGSTKRYKTGGMVNSNTKVMASKITKGRSGGTSKAPKKAIPKAMYGASMDPNMMKPGMMNPGMMKRGGSKKK